jgi:hypothetical protein
MKLPKPEKAYVDLAKVRDYCLNPEHPRGRHKARVFAEALGLTAEHAAELRDALLDAVRTNEAAFFERDDFGDRYRLDFLLDRLDRRATVRSLWIVKRGEDFPRFVSCYVL